MALFAVKLGEFHFLLYSVNDHKTNNYHPERKEMIMEQDSNLLDKIIRKVNHLSIEQLKDLFNILSEWDQGETREFMRRAISTEMDVVVEDRYFRTQTKDISACGVFIKASGKFEIEKEVRLVFSFPDQEKPFKLKGRIARIETDGIGIEFEKISPYFKKILDDVIWEKS